MFSGCTMPPDSKDAKIGSNDQEDSASAGKKYSNFSAMFVYGSASLQLFLVVWILLRSLGFHLLRQMSSY